MADFLEKDDEDINLAALDIVENDVQENSRGRPSNASLNDFEWSSERSDVDSPGFSQAREPSAVDFSNCLFLIVCWEINWEKQIVMPVSLC